jgi:hypothetical protein
MRGAGAAVIATAASPESAVWSTFWSWSRRSVYSDRVVARLRRASYIAGIVHPWDLRRPGLSGPGCPRRCPDRRHVPSIFPRPCPPVFTDAERLALAGSLAGYRGLTREAYTLTCASSPAGAAPARFRCSPSAAPTSRPSPANWKHGAVPAPPSPGGCAPSPGSTGTPSRRSSWSIPPTRTSAGQGWTTSRMPLPWTATSSARPPDPGHHPQGRQGRHHPARPAHRPRDRPGRTEGPLFLARHRRSGCPRPRHSAKMITGRGHRQ